MVDPHDPQWVRLECGEHSGVTRLPSLAPPTIGIGAYACRSCTDKHVVVAAIIDSIETDLFLTPASAREVAAELLKAAERVDPTGVQ